MVSRQTFNIETLQLLHCPLSPCTSCPCYRLLVTTFPRPASLLGFHSEAPNVDPPRGIRFLTGSSRLWVWLSAIYRTRSRQDGNDNIWKKPVCQVRQLDHDIFQRRDCRSQHQAIVPSVPQTRPSDGDTNQVSTRCHSRLC